MDFYHKVLCLQQERIVFYAHNLVCKCIYIKNYMQFTSFYIWNMLKRTLLLLFSASMLCFLFFSIRTKIGEQVIINKNPVKYYPAEASIFLKFFLFQTIPLSKKFIELWKRDFFNSSPLSPIVLSLKTRPKLTSVIFLCLFGKIKL